MMGMTSDVVEEHLIHVYCVNAESQRKSGKKDGERYEFDGDVMDECE